jgi:membrane protein YqaA with SNARE-associated domain
MDKSVDDIKETLAEIRGGKAVAVWFFGIIGVIAGSLVTWWLGK